MDRCLVLHVLCFFHTGLLASLITNQFWISLISESSAIVLEGELLVELWDRNRLSNHSTHIAPLLKALNGMIETFCTGFLGEVRIPLAEIWDKSIEAWYNLWQRTSSTFTEEENNNGKAKEQLIVGEVHLLLCLRGLQQVLPNPKKNPTKPDPSSFCLCWGLRRSNSSL